MPLAVRQWRWQAPVEALREVGDHGTVVEVTLNALAPSRECGARLVAPRAG